MTHKKEYFKVSAQTYLFVGLFCFFGVGYCIFNVDYGDSKTSIIVGKTVMVCMTLLPSIPCIWYGIAKCVFVYSDRLIFINMLFKSEELLFGEISYYEYNVTQNTIYICCLESRKKKIGFASPKNIRRLQSVLVSHNIREIADFRISDSSESLDDELMYTKLDVIVSCYDKKKWRWLRIFFISFLPSPIFLYIMREMLLVTAILFVVLYAIAIVMFEISLAKDKLIIYDNGLCRYYSFKKPKAILNQEIDYVSFQYTTTGNDMERHYVFYAGGREYFRVPANFTNINQVMNRLMQQGVRIVASSRVHL